MARGKGIHERGDVYWIRYAGTDGKVRRESSGSTEFAVAGARLIDARKKVKGGQDPSPAVKIPNITLSELAVDWSRRTRRTS